MPLYAAFRHTLLLPLPAIYLLPYIAFFSIALPPPLRLFTPAAHYAMPPRAYAAFSDALPLYAA